MNNEQDQILRRRRGPREFEDVRPRRASRCHRACLPGDAFATNPAARCQCVAVKGCCLQCVNAMTAEDLVCNACRRECDPRYRRSADAWRTNPIIQVTEPDETNGCRV